MNLGKPAIDGLIALDATGPTLLAKCVKYRKLIATDYLTFPAIAKAFL
jgi:hypothetical protein